MDFTESLKKNSDFLRVYRKRKSRADKRLVLYVRKNEGEVNRLGISVSKKVGNSVVRHRVKRLVKEAYRLNESAFLRGYDLVFVARTGLGDVGCQDMAASVLFLANKHSLLRIPED